MNEKIKQLAEQARIKDHWSVDECRYLTNYLDENKFAKLIVQQCIDKIETYRIPVGNSPSGELACEWAYAALKEIRDDIKESFGITNA
jgi:hypothetical protein